MIQETSKTSVGFKLSRLKPFIVVASLLTILLSLVRWGGTATSGPLFILGISLQLGVLAAFVAVAVWLYVKPPKTTLENEATMSYRSLAGALAASGGLMFGLGGLWDEIWHRRYGGFGDDFFWPPHFLIYSSFAIIAFFASAGLVWVVSRGRGNLRERFRQEPLIGLLALSSLYLTLNAPVDELWHRIYGVDITAWSLPHISVFLGMTLALLVAIPLALSSLPQQAWRGLKGLRWQEWLALLLLSSVLSTFSQIGTSEWEGLKSIPSTPVDVANAFWQRPEWLYPVILINLSLFCGTLAVRTLRRVGVATLVGVLMVSLRFVTLYSFGGFAEGMTLFTSLALLPGLLLVDLWHWFQLRHNSEPRWTVLGALSIALIYLAVLLPLINAFLVYPRVNASTLPGMIGWGLVMAFAAGWAGRGLGNWLSDFGRSTATVVKGSRVAQITLAALTTALVLAFVIVFTATPPA